MVPNRFIYITRSMNVVTGYDGRISKDVNRWVFLKYVRRTFPTCCFRTNQQTARVDRDGIEQQWIIHTKENLGSVPKIHIVLMQAASILPLSAGQYPKLITFILGYSLRHKFMSRSSTGSCRVFGPSRFRSSKHMNRLLSTVLRRLWFPNPVGSAGHARGLLQHYRRL